MKTVVWLNNYQRGHVNPTLPVTAQLTRTGHRVVYFAFEGERRLIEATGAEYRECITRYNYRQTFKNPFQFFSGLMETALELTPWLLPQVAALHPDVIVHDAGCPWGYVVAQRLKVPAVATVSTFVFGEGLPAPGEPKNPVEMAALARTQGRDLLRYAALRSRLRFRYCLPPSPFVDVMQNLEACNLVFTSALFQPGAERLGDHFRFVGPSLAPRPHDEPFPYGALSGDVAYVSMGTAFNDTPALFRAAAAGLTDVEGSVVLALGQQVRLDDLGVLPQNVLAQAFVPQLEVLERARVFVTHGGMNSVNEALYYGVPLVVIPQNADQPLVARRVHELGAGVVLNPDEVSAETLKESVTRVLDDPSFREEAERVGASLRAAGGYRQAAAEILDHARQPSETPDLAFGFDYGYAS